MPTKQSLIFTVVPQDGAAINGKLKLSVLVAPRLYDAKQLGDFPDWLAWTRNLTKHPLVLELDAGGVVTKLNIDTQPLRPDLWEALFHKNTPVRSHQYNDHYECAKEGVLSYSTRDTLSLLKSIYRKASVELALPEDSSHANREYGHRDRLKSLLKDLHVHWSAFEKGAERQRENNRVLSQGERENAATNIANYTLPELDADGLHTHTVSDKAELAKRFASFHRMPMPKYDAGKNKEGRLLPDPDTHIDFHQTLSALGNYPALQRALGLVFDFELPLAAIAEAHEPPKYLSIIGHNLHSRTPAQMNPVRTAYRRWQLTDPAHASLFYAAPKAGMGRGIFGVALLDAAHFGLAQVDVDGAMHKNIILAESLYPLQDPKNERPGPALAAHPEVYDAGATLPAMRSSGFTLYADTRAAHWINDLENSKNLNASFENNQTVDLHSEDLVRGLRLDVWDDHSQKWHSLHARSAAYRIGALSFDTQALKLDANLDEGWMESAVTSPAPGTDPTQNHFYMHEALARWSGWNLSAPRPDLPLSARPEEGKPGLDADADQPLPGLDIKVDHTVLPGSLPSLRFGRRYRMRARLVNLTGLSPALNDPVADFWSALFALPNFAQDGMLYRRFEPVASPQIVVADTSALTGPGSDLQRLVIRTDNRQLSQDDDAPDTSGSLRHLLPPRTSIELGERLGMFDDAQGKLKGDAATWKLIGARDKGELPDTKMMIAGQEKLFPLIAGDTPKTLSYLPDPLARGVALRDLPGTPSGSLARIDASTPAGAVHYQYLSDPNPRPGSVTMIGFGGEADWQLARGLRIALGEPTQPHHAREPHWDPVSRTLTVYLPKGERHVIATSCYLNAPDLPKMGAWHWLQEEIAERLSATPQPPSLQPGSVNDATTHILQRVVEGGHWMLSPPTLIELAHAVRQPLGQPQFAALTVDHATRLLDPAPITNPLQTALSTGRRDADELASLTAWRRNGSDESYLHGAMSVHGVSTGHIDLIAEWKDPVDDPSVPKLSFQQHKALVDRIDLPTTREDYLLAHDATPPHPDKPGDTGKGRFNGYYDPEHDQVVFVREGDRALFAAAGIDEGTLRFTEDAAPRHHIGDTRHHRIRYQAVAISRYSDCFEKPLAGEPGFSRSSEWVEVSVPATTRPIAPDIGYVLPNFGWQRQTDTGMQRSVRFGGGLRVYLHRPWFSSGEGELLGVALWSRDQAPNDAERERYKAYFSQWGMDPIWQTGGLSGVPRVYDFPDRVAQASGVSLDAPDLPNLSVDVVGFKTTIDHERGLRFADLTITPPLGTYMPFVRLALVRFQPEALPDARISRVVLADFAQLTPDRAILVHADPAHALNLRVQISGLVPLGPLVNVGSHRPRLAPTRFQVRLQERVVGMESDLAWTDAAPDIASIVVNPQNPPSPIDGLAIWTGEVRFSRRPALGKYRLLIEEYESVATVQPERLIFAETLVLDPTLLPDPGS